MNLELREIFVSYVERMKRNARRSYEVDLQLWATLAAAGVTKQKRPEPPAILGAPKIIVGG